MDKDQIRILMQRAENIETNRQDGINAMLDLGVYYATTHNAQEAEKWWIEAKKYGSPEASMNLGLLYYQLCTTSKDTIDKAIYMHKAGENLLPFAPPEGNSAKASLFFGILSEHLAQSISSQRWPEQFQSDAATHQCYLIAADYYDRAASAPDTQSDLSPAIAANALARLHLQDIIGFGRNANQEMAYGYYHMAAEAGYGEAQFNMAVLHYCGIGTPVSLVESEKWLALAVENILEENPAYPGFKQLAARELVRVREELNGGAPYRAIVKFSAGRLAFPAA